MFCEVGAWQNIEVLEDSLTLDELFCLTERTYKRESRLLRTVAAAMGAEMEDEQDYDAPEIYRDQTVDGLSGVSVPGQIRDASDVHRMPIGLGYEAN